MKALSGIKVLDFSQGAAGPYASMTLGDFGAEIIKVEPPSGDWSRTLGPPFIEGESVTYLSLNRNKRSIVIDLKHPEGRDIALKMARNVDVIIESFRPGVLDKMGLGYNKISSINPKVIYCSISGFGQNGPWKNKPGVDGIIQAVSGFMSVTGTEGMSPIKAGTLIADMMGGTLASNGILLSLIAREKTGRGQKVDQSLFDAMLATQLVGLCSYLASGELPSRLGSEAPYAVPNGAFPTKDGYIMIAANLESKWTSLCKLLNKIEWLEDLRFSSNKNRVENRKLLIPLLEEVLATKNTHEWIKLLENYDIICSPITNYEDLVSLQQVKQNEMITEMEHPYVGSFKIIGIPQKLSSTPGKQEKHPPMLGQHSEEILQEFGYNRSYIEDVLDTRGVVQLNYKGEGVVGK